MMVIKGWHACTLETCHRIGYNTRYTPLITSLKTFLIVELIFVLNLSSIMSSWEGEDKKKTCLNEGSTTWRSNPVSVTEYKNYYYDYSDRINNKYYYGTITLFMYNNVDVPNYSNGQIVISWRVEKYSDLCYDWSIIFYFVIKCSSWPGNASRG